MKPLLETICTTLLTLIATQALCSLAMFLVYGALPFGQVWL